MFDAPALSKEAGRGKLNLMYYVLTNWTIYYDTGAGKPAHYRRSFSSYTAAMQWVSRNQPGSNGKNKYA